MLDNQNSHMLTHPPHPTPPSNKNYKTKNKRMPPHTLKFLKDLEFSCVHATNWVHSWVYWNLQEELQACIIKYRTWTIFPHLLLIYFWLKIYLQWVISHNATCGCPTYNTLTWCWWWNLKTIPNAYHEPPSTIHIISGCSHFNPFKRPMSWS